MNDTFRNEYVNRVNKVTEYIHTNITEELTLDSLADVAMFSKYHFHRIFKTVVGVTLNEYITRARVQEAARKLLYSPELSVTDIAFQSGFTSLSNFARVFKNQLNVTASEYRHQKDSKIGKTQSRMLEAIPPSQEYIRDVISTWEKTGTDVSVQVKRMQAYHVIFIRQYGVASQNIMKASKKLMKWMSTRDLLSDEREQILVGYDDPEVIPLPECRCDVCYVVPEGTKGSDEIGTMDIPGGKHACCHLEATPDRLPNDMAHAFYVLYAEWLPESGYQPDNRPYYQVFRNNREQGTEMQFIVDICLPVKPL